MKAAQALEKEGASVRVVSMPSWELFEQQPVAYRTAVLPPEVTARISIEAASTFGWERYVGGSGAMIGLNRFGASAPGEVVMRELGFTVENVLAHARPLLNTPSGADAGRRKGHEEKSD